MHDPHRHLHELSGRRTPDQTAAYATAFGIGLQNIPEGLAAALSLAGGAMIWVVSSEIIPETHRDHQEGNATYALMLGLVAMMGTAGSLAMEPQAAALR